MRVEDRMDEKFGSADCGLRNADWRCAQIVISEIAHGCPAKDRHQELDIVRRCRFVERNTDCAWAERAQIASCFSRVLQNDLARFHFYTNRVEEILVRDIQA